MGLPLATVGDRFELRGELGSGGMGVVYRVLDRERGREVALKELSNNGGVELYRFKREFRSLADLAHPNLVMLHQLFTVGNRWMFTMELIDGVPFDRWVRPADALDVAHLRGALVQLVDGVEALHVAGKLHRDLKPSNVLVDRNGRVVILDFGLITDLTAFHSDPTHDLAAVGTPTFMSPEQAADWPLTDATDWYSVGCMLYLALTGRAPFAPAPEAMARKSEEDPPHPRELAPDAPADLDRLCMQLLDRDPMRRPGGERILAALDRRPSPATRRIAELAAHGPFVGRGRELTDLREALAISRRHGAVVAVLGRSGIGKTALARAFLDEISADGEAMILEGRCFEREVVTHKTLDPVIDSLTAHLMCLPRAEVDRLVPRDVDALLRLFPVLRRIPGTRPSLPFQDLGDPIAVRQRALQSLRELLRAIADTRPVVIAIDDAQWGDLEGSQALGELIRGPDPPHVLVVLCHRLENVEGSPVLEALRHANRDALRELIVEPLPDADAHALWGALGGDPCDVGAARDAGGNPLLLAEIARARAAGERVLSVEDAVRGRADRLDDGARTLLRTVALSGRPLRPELLATAAGLSDPTAPLAALRLDRLVRLDVAVEPYHDRIREAVVAGMSEDERRAIHGNLARALIDDDSGDHELVAEHWLGAGDRVQAAIQAGHAAREAEERYAFHRAADLYAVMLLQDDLDDATRCAITKRRARSLSAAGRLTEAAEAFRAAASLAEGRARLDLERLGVEQLLRAGHLERGLVAARELLGAVGVSWPTSWRRTLLSFAVERARLRLRGLDFVPRPEREVDPDVIARLDVLRSVSSGFAYVNPIAASTIGARFLREALDAGELRRVTVGYCQELAYLALPGPAGRDRIEDTLTRARRGAEMIGAADVRGLVEVCAGFAAHLCGRFRESYDRFSAGAQVMRRDPADIRWELDLTEVFQLATLWYLGELRELLRLHPIYLRFADERGNVFAQRGLRSWRCNVTWLIRDQPAEARAQVSKLPAPRGTGEQFHLQHHQEVVTNTMIDLYERKAAAALDRIQGAWRDLERSHLLEVDEVAIESLSLRGLAAVAAAPLDARHLRIAEHALRRLERKSTSPHARVEAAQLRAALCAHHGTHEAAIAALRGTIEEAAAAEMLVHHATARLRLGLLLGGSVGRGLVLAAERWMREQGVANPRALAGMLSPGLDDQN